MSCFWWFLLQENWYMNIPLLPYYWICVYHIHGFVSWNGIWKLVFWVRERATFSWGCFSLAEFMPILSHTLLLCLLFHFLLQNLHLLSTIIVEVTVENKFVLLFFHYPQVKPTSSPYFKKKSKLTRKTLAWGQKYNT